MRAHEFIRIIRRVSAIAIFSALVLSAFGASAQSQLTQVFVTWETTNLYPANFEGKVLPTFGSPVSVSVEATRNGILLDLSQADITWELDGKFLIGGTNAHTARFIAAKGVDDTHFILVRIARGDERLETSLRIPVRAPSLAIDAPYPSGEGMGGSMTLYAIPFFFNATSLSNLSFSWLVDGERLATRNDHALTISSEGILNPRTFRVTLEATNTRDPGETATRRGTFTLFP